MWIDLKEQLPPHYKKLLIWVENGPHFATFNGEDEFIYWDKNKDFKGIPTHWMEITKPETKKRVCF